MKEELLCSFCLKARAQWICNDCFKLNYLCENCFNISHESEFRKSHKKEKIEENSQENVIKTRKLEDQCFCDLHEDRKLKYLCKSCLIPTCSYCLKLDIHKGHEALLFEYDYQEIMKINENEISKINNDLVDCKKMVHDCIFSHNNFV